MIEGKKMSDNEANSSRDAEPQENTSFKHPVESMLRVDSMPSIWCPGCGIGIVVNTFLQTVKKMEMDPNNVRVLSSGIGCAGKIAEYLNFESQEESSGNVIKHAVDLSEKNPQMKVVVFLNDADFIVSGVDDLIEAIKRNSELLVVYINNSIYRILVEHKDLKDTPFSSAMKNDDSISPFNIPHLAKSFGATYVARWTPLHVRRLGYSMRDALLTEGPSVIEVVSPCLMYHVNTGDAGKSVDRMEAYHEGSTIIHNEQTENLDLRGSPEIVLGKFMGREMVEE
jgi:2-oxoglutarate ferredoxin oxidoreductase subunit beta